MKGKGKINYHSPALWWAGLCLIICSCSSERQRAEDLYDSPALPAHFPAPHYTVDLSERASAKSKLGRMLFYDPALSRNGEISCGSCHRQQGGFSDPGQTFSRGIEKRVGLRNSPALANLAWQPSLMADGGINHLDVMALAPLTDSLEMGQELSDILMTLRENGQYSPLFRAAYGDTTISVPRLLRALGHFLSTLVSANSRYDMMLQGKLHFTKREERGYQLFQKHCSSCHREPLLSDFSFQSNGVKSADPGRARISQQAEDVGKFKVPGLRNIEFSAPYMHNGSLQSLPAVIDHYARRIAQTQSDTLSPTQREDLLHFLYTTSDHQFIQNPRFSDPGKP